MERAEIQFPHIFGHFFFNGIITNIPQLFRPGQTGNPISFYTNALPKILNRFQEEGHNSALSSKYSDCGDAFGKIGKAMGMNICGKALCLYYDSEFKETDADFEACLPVRKGKSADTISVRELAGGHCVSLIHKGPYDTLSRKL